MKVDKMYSDADLLAAIRNKDTLDEAIRYMYHHYADTISSLIINNSGNRQDAQDIFQETVVTFIDVVRKNKFRGESSIKTFLVSLARNIWLNQLRKRDRSSVRDVVFEKSRDTTESDVSEHIADLESKRILMATIEKLGEKCRKILVMFYFQELSTKEMLQHLPYENEQVVRNKKHKCLQELSGLIRSNPLITKTSIRK